MSINKMKLENLICSYWYDNGIAVPCGLQYGEVSESVWSSWFSKVDQVTDGISNKPNEDGLSLWRDGRGSFVDMFNTQCQAFVDVKAIVKFNGILNKKFELWAGSPVAGEKREDAMSQSKDEVVQSFIGNKSNHQIIQTLESADKPYILCITTMDTKVDGTWDYKCAYINVSAYLAHREENFDGSRSKSGISGLIFRTKCQTSVDGSESISARVEVKFWNSLEELVDMGMAVITDKDGGFAEIL